MEAGFARIPAGGNLRPVIGNLNRSGAFFVVSKSKYVLRSILKIFRGNKNFVIFRAVGPLEPDPTIQYQIQFNSIQFGLVVRNIKK